MPSLNRPNISSAIIEHLRKSLFSLWALKIINHYLKQRNESQRDDRCIRRHVLRNKFSFNYVKNLELSYEWGGWLVVCLNRSFSSEGMKKSQKKTRDDRQHSKTIIRFCKWLMTAMIDHEWLACANRSQIEFTFLSHLCVTWQLVNFRNKFKMWREKKI